MPNPFKELDLALILLAKSSGISGSGNIYIYILFV